MSSLDGRGITVSAAAMMNASAPATGASSASRTDSATSRTST
jgi:hypothetical protein